LRCLRCSLGVRPTDPCPAAYEFPSYSNFPPSVFTLGLSPGSCLRTAACLGISCRLPPSISALPSYVVSPLHEVVPPCVGSLIFRGLSRDWRFDPFPTLELLVPLLSLFLCLLYDPIMWLCYPFSSTTPLLSSHHASSFPTWRASAFHPTRRTRRFLLLIYSQYFSPFSPGP